MLSVVMLQFLVFPVFKFDAENCLAGIITEKADVAIEAGVVVNPITP